MTSAAQSSPSETAARASDCEVADLVDAAVLRTTLNEEFGPINAANLRRAHALLESGKAVGKLVLTGF